MASLGGSGEIYAITDVATIPLSSYQEAKNALEKLDDNGSSSTNDTAAYESDPEEFSGDVPHDPHIEGHGTEADFSRPRDADSANPLEHSQSGAPVPDTQTPYRSFAQRWFLRRTWSQEKSGAAQSKTISERQANNKDKTMASNEAPHPVAASSIHKAGSEESSTQNSTEPSTQRDSDPAGIISSASSLLPKLLRTARTLFGSRNFFYSYEYDITRRLSSQKGIDVEKPFYDVVDQEYFWNRHLLQPFIQAKANDFILPLMQGFVGQRKFKIPHAPQEHALEANENEYADYQLTIISRRSTKRPGLRYLRRGVDETGSVANSVETEQIFSSYGEHAEDKVASFVQYRGSIPLFFSQSPYSLKPAPIMHQSEVENQAALERHLLQLNDKYGKIHIASLINKEGVEAPIGQKYEKAILQYNQAHKDQLPFTVDFEAFDFHKECRGMKFENVSILIKKLAPQLEEMGYSALSPSKTQYQSGIIRTNCMDCLDRTNVVQAAFGAKALEAQLRDEGISVDLETNLNTQWFNSLWADNGDAISRQYASTAALKGDYTRTRKRDYRGALNDLGLTMTRYYNNIFGDFFTQAAIDFLLGYTDSSAFVDFEATMMTNDPAISMSKVRGAAIDTCSKLVIADQNETVSAAWALLSPKEPNTVRSLPLEEMILLLTNAALYIVRFDWNTEKVTSFERIDLPNIKTLVCGTYVTHPFTPAQLDEKSNIGILTSYLKGSKDSQRTMSRSLSTSLSKQEEGTTVAPPSSPSSWFSTLGLRRQGGPGPTELSLTALKAMSPKESFLRIGAVEKTNLSEQEQVKTVADQIEHTLSESREDSRRQLIENHPIISAAEAKKNTGYINYLGHSLKRLVWA